MKKQLYRYVAPKWAGKPPQHQALALMVFESYDRVERAIDPASALLEDGWRVALWGEVQAVMDAESPIGDILRPMAALMTIPKWSKN